MPLLSIWEGSGNVMCLDVLRVVQQEPDALDAFISRIDEARGGNAMFDAFARQLPECMHKPSEADGRRVAHAITLAMQGALLIEHAPAAVADAFCATRLVSEAYGHAGFGLLPHGTEPGEILRRSGPQQVS
jgi:putative acyl-CoA dehydrogenase